MGAFAGQVATDHATGARGGVKGGAEPPPTRHHPDRSCSAQAPWHHTRPQTPGARRVRSTRLGARCRRPRPVAGSRAKTPPRLLGGLPDRTCPTAAHSAPRRAYLSAPACSAVAVQATTTPAPTSRRPRPRRRRSPLAGYDDTTPPPAIHATGTDYAAIAASLENYRAWLLAHHPDSALAKEIYQQGTVSYQDLVVVLDDLRARHQTLVSIDRHQTYTFSSIHASLMTMRMHEVLTEDRTLDRDHRVVKTKTYSWPNEYVVIMTHDSFGRWRIADLTDIMPERSIPL